MSPFLWFLVWHRYVIQWKYLTRVQVCKLIWKSCFFFHFTCQRIHTMEKRTVSLLLQMNSDHFVKTERAQSPFSFSFSRAYSWQMPRGIPIIPIGIPSYFYVACIFLFFFFFSFICNVLKTIANFSHSISEECDFSGVIAFCCRQWFNT